jgi:predicted nucleic acid-binding protein
MIAADTSTWIAFLEGSKGEDAQLLDKALEDRQVPSPLLRFKEFLEGPVKLFLRRRLVAENIVYDRLGRKSIDRVGILDFLLGHALYLLERHFGHLPYLIAMS